MLSVWAKEKDSFITESEYAEHLYKNPRGIGCHKCHGEKGEGMLISSYKHKGEKKALKTHDITALSYEQFHKALDANKGMMPKYFLTEKEIQALYRYLHKDYKK
jgi:mono/diheme cytochrome c family protein